MRSKSVSGFYPEIVFETASHCEAIGDLKGDSHKVAFRRAKSILS